MAYIDTRITEAEASRFDGHQYEEVRLVSMGGALGTKVWYRSQLIENAGAALQAKRPAVKRLLVAVEGEHDTESAVQRVRAALQWLGEPSPCPF